MSGALMDSFSKISLNENSFSPDEPYVIPDSKKQPTQETEKNDQEMPSKEQKEDFLAENETAENQTEVLTEENSSKEDSSSSTEELESLVLQESDSEPGSLQSSENNNNEEDWNFEDSYDTEDEDEPIGIPEWFSNEELDQLKEIFCCYNYSLNLQDTKRVREPPKFVGKIVRARVYSEPSYSFQTLDTVDIYRRCATPPGEPIPHVKTVHILTNWSIQDGVPLMQQKLRRVEKDYWNKRIISGQNLSAILCEPIYDSSEYDYFISENNEEELRHSPFSYPSQKYFGPWVGSFLKRRNNSTVYKDLPCDYNSEKEFSKSFIM